MRVSSSEEPGAGPEFQATGCPQLGNCGETISRRSRPCDGSGRRRGRRSPAARTSGLAPADRPGGASPCRTSTPGSRPVPVRRTCSQSPTSSRAVPSAANARYIGTSPILAPGAPTRAARQSLTRARFSPASSIRAAVAMAKASNGVKEARRRGPGWRSCRSGGVRGPARSGVSGPRCRYGRRSVSSPASRLLEVAHEWATPGFAAPSLRVKGLRLGLRGESRPDGTERRRRPGTTPSSTRRSVRPSSG